MRIKKEAFYTVLFSIFLMFVAAFWVAPRISEGACGAAASSCKNCHEIKGEMKVNAKGDYHTQHAFGDFCVFCHSGNTAATNKAEAHEGMVKPLGNLEQSCASCHPDDFQDRAKGYGAVIKSQGSPGGSGPAATGPETTVAAGKSGSACTTMAAVTEKPAALKVESYEILPPTPDPATVKPDEMIDYNLYWVKKGLPGTLGDRILVLMSLLIAAGFPILNWIYRKDKKDKPQKGVSMRKSIMDEGRA
jgi:hypothetical protein